MFLTKAMRRLESAKELDPVIEAVTGATNAVLPPGQVKDALHGTWLGHALHPMLVALPIGMNVGATMLDLFGDELDRDAARKLVGVSLLTVAPTALSGLADWSSIGQSRRPRRVGLVHASANVGATLLYTASWLARKGGRHGTGTVLALAGASSLVVGGYLGGHLAYVNGIGVNHAMGHKPEPKEWTDAGAVADLEHGTMRAEVEGQAVVVVSHDDGQVSAMGAVCSHLGGPLDEGEIEDGCLVCPWHGSKFRIEDGSVAAGPATVDQPPYDARVVDGRVQVRARAV